MSDNLRESYAREKLMQAVYALATLPGSVQERLAEASRDLFLALPEDISDESLRWILVGIRDDLSFNLADGSEGRIRATLKITNDEDASRVARRIMDLDRELTEQHYRRQGPLTQ